jgi:hypothetical protein
MNKKRSTGIVIEGGGSHKFEECSIVGFDDAVRLLNTNNNEFKNTFIGSADDVVAALNGAVERDEVEEAADALSTVDAADREAVEGVLSMRKIGAVLKDVAPDVAAFVIKTLLNLGS